MTLPDQRDDLPGTLITAAQMHEHLAKMRTAKRDDVPMNMVKIGGAGDKKQAGISIVYREKGPRSPANYAVHDDVAEVYYLHCRRRRHIHHRRLPPDPTNRTAGIMGGEAHDVKPGDIIVVPAGTPHWFSKINGYVTIVECRYPSARSQKK